MLLCLGNGSNSDHLTRLFSSHIGFYDGQWLLTDCYFKHWRIILAFATKAEKLNCTDENITWNQSAESAKDRIRKTNTQLSIANIFHKNCYVSGGCHCCTSANKNCSSYSFCVSKIWHGEKLWWKVLISDFNADFAKWFVTDIKLAIH